MLSSTPMVNITQGGGHPGSPLPLDHLPHNTCLQGWTACKDHCPPDSGQIGFLKAVKNQANFHFHFNLNAIGVSPAATLSEVNTTQMRVAQPTHVEFCQFTLPGRPQATWGHPRATYFRKSRPPKIMVVLVILNYPACPRRPEAVYGSG
jgi:hypothetical protein